MVQVLYIFILQTAQFEDVRTGNLLLPESDAMYTRTLHNHKSSSNIDMYCLTMGLNPKESPNNPLCHVLPSVISDLFMQCFVIETRCNTEILFDGSEMTEHLVADIEPSQAAHQPYHMSCLCHAQNWRHRCKCDSGTFQIQILNIFIFNRKEKTEGYSVSWGVGGMEKFIQGIYRISPNVRRPLI